MTTALAFLGLLAAGVANWVMMNNKVTRLETKVETMERDRDDINKRLEVIRLEIKADYERLSQDITKILLKLNA